MNPLKNISLNLKAAGVSAIVCVWVICVTTLGLLGEGEMSERAMSILAFAGGAILVSLSSSS